LIFFIAWYLFITILGWLVFPIAFRMIPALKDRGYTISRTLGILLWGYCFWLLASLRILNNDIVGLLFALILLISTSIWALRGGYIDHIKEWLRNQRRLVLLVEVLFFIAFAFLTIIRAANPEAVGTEKPMELAFINAILRSDSIPPHDPWLSGYAISYYYFGYVIIAMIAKFTATPGSVAFNLGISLIFGLCAVGTYGIVFNLLNSRKQNKIIRTGDQQTRFHFAALLAPLFVLVVSNLEGFLHMLHTRGMLWSRDSTGKLTSAFWKWLDIKDLNIPPQEPFSWIPTRFWWWWRASRVLQDYDLAGNLKEIINEFPFFSFLLADLHPHVLVMPFTYLVITLALNLLLGGSQGKIGWLNLRIGLRALAWIGLLAVPAGILCIVLGALRLSGLLAGAGILLLVSSGFIWIQLFHKIPSPGISKLFLNNEGFTNFGAVLFISPAELTLFGIALGGMAFLNTWDFPFYLALFAALYAFRRAIDNQLRISATLKDFIWFGFVMGIFGIMLYFPFYLGFSSQAGGILPNLIYPTRGVHLWVMFAPLFVPIFIYLFFLYKRKNNSDHSSQPTNFAPPQKEKSVGDDVIKIGNKRILLLRGFILSISLILSFWIASLLLGLLITSIPQVSDLFLSTLSTSIGADLFHAAIMRRLLNPGGWITLLGLLTFTLTLLINWESPLPELRNHESNTNENTSINYLPISTSPPNLFTILLILLGALLVLGPEFFFLRDLFGWRMNTIFKFYFQAWLVWSIAAAYGSIVMFVYLKGILGNLFRLVFVLLLGMSLVYPYFSLWNKTNGFQPSEWTLDSTAYLLNDSTEEMAAIAWLETAPFGVVAEAVPSSGGSYTQYGRVSMLSGLPAVLGWVGHENQWRGGGDVLGSRQNDLERLYCSRDWIETQAILDQYNIRYVFLSTLEHTTYKSTSCSIGVVENKFQRYLNPVFQQGQVMIFEYMGSVIH